MYAVMDGHDGAASVLLDAHASTDVQDDVRVAACVCYMSHGPPRVSLRARVQRGTTALMSAAIGGHGAVLTALLEAHANTELQDFVRVAAWVTCFVFGRCGWTVLCARGVCARRLVAQHSSTPRSTVSTPSCAHWLMQARTRL